MKFRPNADMTASVLAHLLLLVLIFLYSEVHQFDPVAADTVPVEVVTQQEAAEVKPDPVPSPSPTPEFQLPSLDKPVEHSKPESTQAPAAQPPQKQAAPQQKQPQQKQPEQKQPEQKQATPPAPPPAPTPQQAATAEPAPQPSQPVAPQPAQPPPPAYKPPQPDASVKYGVILGLPPYLPPEAPAGTEPGKDNFDAPATEKADVGNSVVAEFRRHLKTCMKLPANMNPDDDVRVKLRVLMTPDGKLASAPQLIEATASAKGPLLLRSATSALEACQPYAMLPRDRYGEWKVLDLDFSPRDFAS
jgi:outer membrane biosynthesis protein TonB